MKRRKDFHPTTLVGFVLSPSFILLTKTIRFKSVAAPDKNNQLVVSRYSRSLKQDGIPFFKQIAFSFK